MSSICQFSQEWDVPFLLHCWVLFSAQLSPWLLFCGTAALPVVSCFTLEFSFQAEHLFIDFVYIRAIPQYAKTIFVCHPASGVPATPLSLALSANFMCLFCNIIQGIKDNIEWATCMKDPRRTPCNALSLIASCNLWLECWIYLNPGHACNLNFTLVHRVH